MSIPDGIAAIYAELKRRRFGSLAEAQAFLDRRMREYDTAPQADLGGLSPHQVDALGRGDWLSSGPLRVSGDLGLADVQDAELFDNVRMVLRLIAEVGVAGTTPSGLWNRKFVALAFERARWLDPEDRDHTLTMCKVLNEYDVQPLTGLRYLLRQLGLIRRRKGFLLSPEGRRLLDDAHAGELYQKLLVTGFRELDLRRETPEHPDAQDSLAFALYQVGRITKDWRSPRSLEPVVWLGDLGREREEAPKSFSPRRFMTEYRLVHTLVRFGLLERRYTGEGPRWLQLYEVRKTPLFDRAVGYVW
ncbi:MAG: hypothetical protein ABI836_00670 [Gemmatimonadota bacterium]